MNGRREDPSDACYFHPDKEFVGVCPLCLHERLLILASQQKHHRHSRTDSGGQGRSQPSTNPRPPINLPKIFALGSLLNRLEFRHYWRSESVDFDREASTSPEDDSFISIKFEDNGAASWEKKNTDSSKSKISLDNCNISWNNPSLNKVDANTKTTTIAAATATATATATSNNRSVIEHVKPRAGSLRWRKRIGHLFHLIRWKRSSKASVCHVGAKVEVVKVRNGWIRTLTKRRAKE